MGSVEKSWVGWRGRKEVRRNEKEYGGFGWDERSGDG